MPVDAATLRVVHSYRNQTLTLRARILRYIERSWLGLDNYRDADVDLFVRTVLPVVEGGKRRIASLTDAYLAAVESATFGDRIAPLGLAVTASEALRGVPADEVYRRPGVTVWTALKAGDTLTDAVGKGLERALGLAATDLQLAKTHTARDILGRKRNVTGYRRVLEGSKSCGLCVVASTQRYRKEHLLPIHGRCDCSVLPIYGNKDPGLVIDPDTLEGVHAAIEERFGASDPGARGGNGIPHYRDVLITHEHGELGPVLAVRGQQFTGPDDL